MEVRNEVTQAERVAFGGYDKGAAFYGWLVATAVASLLTALLSAVGVAAALNKTTPVTAGQLRTAGWLGGLLWLIALAIAYYAGGYVAGRMARYDGGRQGIGVWAISVVAIIVLAIAGAFLGSSFDLLSQFNLPRLPLGQGSVTGTGIITLVLALAVTLISAMSGAKRGEAYHRRIDEFNSRMASSTAPETANKSTFDRTQPSFGERIEQENDR
jgi:hypothetical protein